MNDLKRRDVDAANFKTFSSSNFPSAGDVEYYIGTGDLSGSSGNADFDGVIDEVRWMNYERNAFAGGIMISQVVPSTNTITIYNLVPKFQKYNIINIELGKEYIIDDIKLIPLEYIKETDSYICNKVDSGDEVAFLHIADEGELEISLSKSIRLSKIDEAIADGIEKNEKPPR